LGLIVGSDFVHTVGIFKSDKAPKIVNTIIQFPVNITLANVL